jgi:hypothetical protein
LLTVDILSQVRPLGGLHRAAPVPFRGSYFTLGLHPPSATPQGLTVFWYRRWTFPVIPSPRLVAHFIVVLLVSSGQISTLNTVEKCLDPVEHLLFVVSAEKRFVYG